MIVIFLDIDGVLNGHQKHENGYCGIYPECVTRFNRLLDAVPNAMVVGLVGLEIPSALRVDDRWRIREPATESRC
jgi:hypothetical protein